MTKYTIDTSSYVIRLFNGEGKELTDDMRSTVMNLVTAVACGDLMIVRCTEAGSDIPVFLLCAFIDAVKYKAAKDLLIPLCELAHPLDIMECVRPPDGMPRAAFSVHVTDAKTLNAFVNSSYQPLVDEEAQEDHSKHTKH